MFMESKAGFLLNKPPSYFLPWSVSGGGGRIAGKTLQIEQGNVRKLIGNKIDLTLFPLFASVILFASGFRIAALHPRILYFPPSAVLEISVQQSCSTPAKLFDNRYFL